MLKALELVGFKSFADKTRFEFPDGITVVVGPNGSGKSNVVDAVKWVLGAQSAKALRGADMADVIFKGSAEGGRKPANSAEVVLVLDNSTRIFNHDTDEVHVCRRVFRSGEGEYSINGQPCRLKDVKDLFRGTGVGVDAYSLIEQGKVDRLLQSSNKDRRGIFEEAAGISRFKAKKVEAERRLQRVDQNLVRLRDIVDEVGKRLGTLKSQATKAARYREVTQQLTHKRWELGWLEVQLLRRQRASFQEQLDEAIANKTVFAQQWEVLVTETEAEKTKLLALQEELQELQQAYMAAEREAIAAESGYKSANARADELEAEKSVIAERLVALQERAANAIVVSTNRRQELQVLEQDKVAVAAELAVRETELAAAKQSLTELDESIERETSELAALTNSIHELKSKVVGYQFHIEQFQNSIDDLRNQEQTAHAELEAFESEVSDLVAGAERVRMRAGEARENRIDATRKLDAQRRELSERQEQLADMQGRLHGVRERLTVLTQLEEQFEGNEGGGQQLLRLARQHQTDPQLVQQGYANNTGNPWDTVRGLVADIVRSEMHLAPLIDVALGPLADAIVLSSGEIVDWVHQGSLHVDGRVTLLRLDRLPNRRTGEKIQLDGLRGVIGRADRLTQFAPEYEPLIRALLGTTWIVDSLATALELSHFRGAGLRFVTAECQLVDSDGSITIGSLQAGLELISRRTEMQKAIEEIEDREREIEVVAEEVAAFQSELQRDEFLLKALEEDERSTSQELQRVEIQSESIDQRRASWNTKLADIAHQIEVATNRIAEVESQAVEAERDCQEAEREREQKIVVIQQLKDNRISLQAEVQQKQVLTSDQKIALARLEQRYDGLQLALEQMMIDANERERSAQQASQSLEALTQRATDLRNNANSLQASMGTLKEKAEQAEALRIQQITQIDTQNNRVAELVRENDNLRRQIEKNDDKLQMLEQSITQSITQLSELCEHYVREHNVRLPIVIPTNEQSAQMFEGATDVSVEGADQDELEAEPEVQVSHLDSMELLTSADAWVEAMEGMNLPEDALAESEEVQDSELIAESPAPLDFEEQELTPEFIEFQEKIEAIERTEELAVLKSRIDSEITSLRNELASIGSVNMEALAELDAFQDRYDRLAGHQNDLIAAKDGLIKTMAKIDEDSRHLFMETLQSIRANFQDLYRRSFGGGFADIILENENDPDSGIEIIATPPGKTTLSNSLLSGGEKALTAVALIMAFFQYRPSPFCILDEVDAPFDEANIGRFVTVLKEFLSTTKFIVVSHSKKTMTAANMIYGVTMQESGVSRQVSVRFEEVNEKGEVITKDKKLAA